MAAKLPIGGMVRRGMTAAGKWLRDIRETIPEVKLIAMENQTVDLQQAFMYYASFCGDVEKTALALGVTPVEIVKLADEHFVVADRAHGPAGRSTTPTVPSDLRWNAAE